MSLHATLFFRLFAILFLSMMTLMMCWLCCAGYREGPPSATSGEQLLTVSLHETMTMSCVACRVFIPVTPVSSSLRDPRTWPSSALPVGQQVTHITH